MISNDEELKATLEQIRHFQAQIVHLRRTETNCRLSSSGFIAEIDRMQLKVREYLRQPAAEARSVS